jgi:hypothetical protein
VRLRPILMTSLATVAAAVPLALGFGPGAETRAPLARSIIGGIVLSTLVTLVVVPIFYLLLDHFGNWLTGLTRRGRKERKGAPPPQEPVLAADRNGEREPAKAPELQPALEGIPRTAT